MSADLRLYILGGGGSGKTTLARRLGQQLGLPVVHLDDVFWPRDGIERSDVEWRAYREAHIARLTALPAWVIEGGYPGWIEELAGAAHLVVWLDLPFWRAAVRIVRRHVLADLRRANRHPGYRRLWRFLAGQREYYTASGAAVQRRLEARGPDRWTGALNARAYVATHYTARPERILRLTGGSTGHLVRTIAERLAAGEPGSPGTRSVSPAGQ